MFDNERRVYFMRYPGMDVNAFQLRSVFLAKCNYLNIWSWSFFFVINVENYNELYYNYSSINLIRVLKWVRLLVQ
jgi:hypothetical protein